MTTAPTAPPPGGDAPGGQTPDKAALYGAYAAGLFGMGLLDFYVLLVPLWALSIGASATEIGLLVGARSVLPFLFAIHGGALMDRFGSRRMMLVTATASAILAPAYPLMGWFPALLLLQMIVGIMTSYAWIGAQTLIAHASRGDAVHIGRFSFFGRVGTFVVPIIGGATWDFAGPWISFLVVSAWSLVLVVCVWLAPAPATDAVAAAASRRPRMRDALPRLSDYTSAFGLVAIPMVAMTIAMNFLRNTTSAVQGSFYVIYLDDIGLTGTTIGILFSVLEAASGLTSLGAAFYLRFIKPHWLMIGLVSAALTLIAITPLLGGVFALLVTAQFLRGGVQGLIQPVLFSLQARAVPLTAQGSVVGLRVTVNRMSSVTVPPTMGVIVDLAGLEASFLIVGGILLSIVGALALWVKRSPAFAQADTLGAARR